MTAKTRAGLPILRWRTRPLAVRARHSYVHVPIEQGLASQLPTPTA